MSDNLRIQVTQTPDPDAALSVRKFRPTRRMLRSIFGTAEPRHKMAILLPGADTASVEVAVRESDGDITTLAEALGLMGGDSE